MSKALSNSDGIDKSQAFKKRINHGQSDRCVISDVSDYSYTISGFNKTSFRL